MNIKQVYMGWCRAVSLVAVVMMGALNGFAQPYIPEEGSAELSGNSREKRPAKVDPKAQATHSPAHSLFYKAQHPETGNMWDVWLYHHEGTYYLYYLANAGPKPPKGQPWNNISLATSPDGVHWTEKGPILKKADEATWMGTGSTWKSPNFEQDGKFYMNFSEEIGGRQSIYFAESKDLLNWTRLEGEEYRFVQDERWYQKNGRWDCIWTLPKPGGGFYGYWTASPLAKGSKFGFGESDDGLHWKALPPPEVSGVNREHAEVGAVEKIGNKYYMLLGNYPPYMVTLVADRPEGPFRAAEKNFNILTGHTYFCRFFSHPTDGMLVCHFLHDRNGQVSFAPLKDVRIDAEGTLRLGWWKGNEKMKRAAIAVQPSGDTSKAIDMLGHPFDPSKGIILEGTLRLPKGEWEKRSGLYIECGNREGAGVLIDHSGVAELGSIQANGEDFQISERNKRGKKQNPKRVDREMAFANPAKFRLLLKGPLMEFYLDDILIESFALPAHPTGRIGLINSAETLGTLKAWE